ncbi:MULTISPECIES: Tfp pilus assembly protein FimT/FimU [unclassified Acinetobacter]|uniref:pilus assembly FimT family protein n=1 Tax=unclassified Acinetobacter TaxID=196816 RepID=UPI0029348278|nr:MULTISPECIES: GspH/FimT family pseudopilin [unclassified Acinetobacter]WOE33037.1 GspH/FimT family pseudopilin [Acinetobacter sp. SAAs470]WOE38515.1 GspH/FimT family pseudopilin [Acinetobacter sp. SAAs474]
MFYNKNLGLCLIEVFIVLAILILCASLIFPYFQHLWARQELSQVTHHLYQQIHLAKNAAQLRHSNIILCCSHQGQQCELNCWHRQSIVFADLNQNRQIDPNEPILDHRQLNLKYGQLNWHGALRSPCIVFKAHLGHPIGYNGSFYYQSHILPLQQRIILSKTAHIRVEIATLEQN